MHHPLRFVKEHPVGTVVSGIGGMVVGPWVLRMVQRFTGFGVRVPSVGE